MTDIILCDYCAQPNPKSADRCCYCGRPLKQERPIEYGKPFWK